MILFSYLVLCWNTWCAGDDGLIRDASWYFVRVSDGSEFYVIFHVAVVNVQRCWIFMRAVIVHLCVWGSGGWGRLCCTRFLLSFQLTGSARTTLFRVVAWAHLHFCRSSRLHRALLCVFLHVLLPHLASVELWSRCWVAALLLVSASRPAYSTSAGTSWMSLEFVWRQMGLTRIVSRIWRRVAVYSPKSASKSQLYSRWNYVPVRRQWSRYRLSSIGINRSMITVLTYMLKYDLICRWWWWKFECLREPQSVLLWESSLGNSEVVYSEIVRK